MDFLLHIFLIFRCNRTWQAGRLQTTTEIIMKKKKRKKKHVKNNCILVNMYIRNSKICLQLVDSDVVKAFRQQNTCPMAYSGVLYGGFFFLRL